LIFSRNSFNIPFLLNKSLFYQNLFNSNFIFGNLRDDTLNGSSDNDIMLGLLGDDQLFGEDGDDQLLGGFGNDVLDGGSGQNRLLGGPGSDYFVLANSSDDRLQTILDYKDGTDQFKLTGGLTFSQLAISQVGDDTQIRILGQLETEPIAIIKGTQASSLSTEDFVTTTLTPLFDSLVVFGDSLSDPGNIFDATFSLFPPSTIGDPPIPAYSDGRFSNGDIWFNYFVNDLGLDPVSTRDTNFAFGGATTGNINALEPQVESLLGMDFDFPGLLDQVSDYLDGGNVDPNGLYVIWAGANDLFNLPEDPTQIPTFLTQSVENITDAITTLAVEGAETFLIPNLPDLGRTPRILNGDNSASVTMLVQGFNAALTTALDQLEMGLQLMNPAIDIVEADVFSRTADILGAPEKFGFDNVIDPLINNPTESGYFWFDEIHPTTTIHETLSDVFQAELLAAGLLEESNLLLNSGTSSMASDMGIPADWLAASASLFNRPELPVADLITARPIFS
jgi:phospholipase/lecithinase/hemolysin